MIIQYWKFAEWLADHYNRVGDSYWVSKHHDLEVENWKSTGYLWLYWSKEVNG
jgi:hypothetical protein